MGPDWVQKCGFYLQLMVNLSGTTMDFTINEWNLCMGCCEKSVDVG